MDYKHRNSETPFSFSSKRYSLVIKTKAEIA